MKQNIKDNQRALDTLMDSTLNTINVIVKHNESFAVVYVISSKYDDTVIYVGETSHLVVE